MMAAAACAAASADGASFGANSAITSRITSRLREAIAEAMNVPAFFSSSSNVSAARLDRLMQGFSISGCLQELFALLPVARAELVGLQRVERAQHLVDIAADVHVDHRDKADDAVGVDDEGGAQRHAFLALEHAEGAGQLEIGR